MLAAISTHFANKGGDFARFAVCAGHNGFRNSDMHRYALSGAAHANNHFTHVLERMEIFRTDELSNRALCCLENVDASLSCGRISGKYLFQGFFLLFLGKFV